MKKAVSILLLLISALISVDAQRYRASELKSISTSTEWELAPVLYNSGLVYLSNRIIPSTRLPVNAEGGGALLDIYYVPIDADDKFGKAEQFSNRFHTDADDGPLTFAQNDQMLCVVILNGHAGNGLPKNGNGGLYFSYKSGDNWGELIPFEHNDVFTNFSTPFLTPDGLTLYFSAENMDDSFGSWDIYVSNMNGNRWTKPENLGNTINTPEWDFFPFLHPSGRLYFSSNGHDARGGSFDLFSSNMFNNEWSNPIPVPSLNTYSDELALVINDDYSQGYFTRKTGNDFDIFRFEYPNYESFTNPRPIQRNRFCFRLRETSLDTIDYTMFYYEWVINDTLVVPGHDIKFCFPGPGEYYLNFNVTNKVTDTTMYDVASLYLNLELYPQPVITAPDTVRVGDNISFSSAETFWKEWPIEGFYWDFGNGVQEKGVDANFQYTSPGEYTVVLGIKEKTKTRNRRFPPAKESVFKNIVVLSE